jgi:hypothetical protein
VGNHPASGEPQTDFRVTGVPVSVRRYPLMLMLQPKHQVSRCLSHFYYLLSSEHRMTSMKKGTSPKSTPREAPGEEKVGYMQNNCHNFAWESIRTGDDDTPHSLVPTDLIAVHLIRNLLADFLKQWNYPGVTCMM